MDSAGVGCVPVPADQPQPGELGELQRSGRAGDSEPGGELAHGDRGLGVEVVENAGLVLGETLPAGRIALAATAAGGMDGGIGRENRLDGIVEHRSKMERIL